MALYTGRTSKYTRSARFDVTTLAAINDLKARHRQQQVTEREQLMPATPLLCAPPCAGLLPAPGHTSAAFTQFDNPRDKLLIGGQTFAIGKAYVTSDLESAFAAQRQTLTHLQVGAKVRIRHGRTGTILRILTDGRCVVRINEMSFLAWEFYQQSELEITLDQEVVKAA